jgi:hypothetical protein
MSKRYCTTLVILFTLLNSTVSFSQSKKHNMETSPTPLMEKRIQAILTLDMENIPANFPDIIKHEQEVVAQWKEEGILENLFLRKEKNGAVLIFKNIDEEKVKERMTTLPLYALKKSVEYFSLMKQF